MSALPDLVARTTALTAIHRSLLVEAGAGSGKTSVMAGRVAVLFANGVEPKHIAAITFTEFAASELRLRIEEFATTLSKGEVPRDLQHLLPKGITPEQKATVESARKALDQLACTTIHGFAQALLKPYPAEAQIDPGAEIVDPAEADLAFEERYDSWLKQQLSGNGDDGIVEALILGDEAGGLKLVSEVAQFLRRNRDARPAAAAWSQDTVKRVGAATAQFKKGFSKIDYREKHTEAVCRSFIELHELLGGLALKQAKPSNHDLVAAINLPRPEICFRRDGNRRKLQTSGKWQAAAAAAGRSKAEGKGAYDALNGRYESCHDELETLLAAVAGELLARLAAEMQGLLQDWHEYKRAAALLDFDDLLYTARDLLIGHDDVRRALSRRYRHVLVDEFQDTDPLQIEILWLLCGERSGGSKSKALARTLRPGALFLVGDPKQAIYRFRGADVNAYVNARKAIGPGSLLKITTNFRSVEPILAFVNRRFESVLSEAAGQPGFSELSPLRKGSGKGLAVAALDVALAADKPDAAAFRDAEADCVADLCRRLVGNWEVQDHNTSKLRPCRYGDIALLAPVGTELWRFEEALEERGIPVSTQAGKGFFHRQEVQDLIALTRVLADIRDTLALGALLRGPLVGLTEAELLDIADGLPPNADTGRLPMLSLWTNPSQVTHETARSVLSTLQSLRRRARTTTPYILLTDAIAALHMRPQLRQRFKGGPERAIANVDLFLEMARAYGVRGLRVFAHDMRSNWEEAVRQAEGRPDAEQESVSLITVHASKGLEWPVVIPVNMTGVPRAESALVQDRRANVFSIPVLGTEPLGHDVIKTRNELEQARERVRLWYVAATRARDLLVLPRHSGKLPDESWANIVDLGLSDLDSIDPAKLGEDRALPEQRPENQQTREVFAEQAGCVANASHTIVWKRPSRGEVQAEPPTETVPLLLNPEEAEDVAEIPVPAVAGSSTRGILLHKLKEEVLLGETNDGGAYLERRARELLAQLGIEPADDPKSGIAPAELAATVVRTINLPEIQQLRLRLLPELPIFGHQDAGDSEILISGIADAVALDEVGATEAVIDWKSDTDASPKLIEHYRRQIDDYRRRTGAKRALIVMMTSGKTVEIA
jgi:ATP-dependent exoDNAse (exonuclease V) beta subunit